MLGLGRVSSEPPVLGSISSNCFLEAVAVFGCLALVLGPMVKLSSFLFDELVARLVFEGTLLIE